MKIGALANVCLATSKGVIGYTINSTGRVADDVFAQLFGRVTWNVL